jgi:hypothetical protein
MLQGNMHHTIRFTVPYIIKQASLFIVCIISAPTHNNWQGPFQILHFSMILLETANFILGLYTSKHQKLTFTKLKNLRDITQQTHQNC